MDGIVIKGGHVFDPASGIDGEVDIIVMAGSVVSIEEGVLVEENALWLVLDCTGMLVLPGIIDIHTHLREPGFEYKETIETGMLSAAAGGVTTIACMANTDPVNDNAAVTRFIKKKSEISAGIDVLPIGALSVGLKGKDLTDMGELKEAGCVAISDDGVPVTDGSLMRRALEYSRLFDLPVITHAEDLAIASGGVMNEGPTATKLGLSGIPNQAEDSFVARDIGLAELTGGHLHVAHVSTKGSVELIRMAKKRGVNVTAEVTPHHLMLTDDSIIGYDTDFKMSPPLRSREDVDALIEGVKDGTIDAIATDHAPHSSIEKDLEFDSAACGVVGLETSLSLMLTMASKGIFTMDEIVRAMTINPARIFGLNAGTITPGNPADLAIVDPKKRWVVDPSKFYSKSQNSPFKGMELKGRVVRTVKSGSLIYNLLGEKVPDQEKREESVLKELDRIHNEVVIEKNREKYMKENKDKRKNKDRRRKDRRRD